MALTLRVVTGLLTRGDSVLLVATRYPDRAEPLWNLPGGRARPGELLPAALARELLEETGVRARVGSLCFIAESFDPVAAVHVASATFRVETDDEPRRTADPSIVEVAWVARRDLSARIAVAVVREPIARYLDGDPRRYYGYADAGISIRFATDA